MIKKQNKKKDDDDEERERYTHKSNNQVYILTTKYKFLQIKILKLKFR